jgi:hypothetical protein
VTESERASAFVEQAIEVGTAIGDHLAVFTATANKGWIAAYRRDWPQALRAALDGTQQKYELGDTIAPTFGRSGATLLWCLAAIALTELGHYETAAVLLGVFNDKDQGPDWVEEMLEASRAALITDLGERRFESLVSHGAGLAGPDALTYLQEAAGSALDGT